MKYWEVIADKLSAAGFTWGYCSAATRDGWHWVVDARCSSGERHIVESDDLLSAIYEVRTVVGKFLIKKLEDRGSGDFQWGIFSEESEYLAGHFTKSDCQALIGEWISNNYDPTGSAAQRIQYFYSIAGIAIGPKSLVELRQLRLDGTIDDDAYVFKEGDSRWRRLSEFAELGRGG